MLFWILALWGMILFPIVIIGGILLVVVLLVLLISFTFSLISKAYLNYSRKSEIRKQVSDMNEKVDRLFSYLLTSLILTMIFIVLTFLFSGYEQYMESTWKSSMIFLSITSFIFLIVTLVLYILYGKEKKK